MFESAVPLAQKRAKRTATSPALAGDDERPDRDLVGVLCEFAWYEWRYGRWSIRAQLLEEELIAYGHQDGGEDDVGINVRGSFLAEGRILERQHLLISIDPRNSGRLYDHIRYVAAFYSRVDTCVYLPGYLRGNLIRGLVTRHPDYVGKVKFDGFRSYKIPVTKLRSIERIPNIRYAST